MEDVRSPQEKASTSLIVKTAGWIFKGVSSHFSCRRATEFYNLAGEQGSVSPRRMEQRRGGEQTRQSMSGKMKAKGGERQTNPGKYSIQRWVGELWGRNRQSVSGSRCLGGTVRLAEIIAVMDWSYSPERWSLAITQQDDFADLHVMKELHHRPQLFIQ